METAGQCLGGLQQLPHELVGALPFGGQAKEVEAGCQVDVVLGQTSKDFARDRGLAFAARRGQQHRATTSQLPLDLADNASAAYQILAGHDRRGPQVKNVHPSRAATIHVVDYNGLGGKL